MNRFRGYFDDAIRGIGRADEYIQAGIRDNILRLPNDGSQLSPDAKLASLRELLGKSVHQSTNPNAQTYYRIGAAPGDKYGVYAGRALQAGGLTAAGVGLLNLTHALSNTFGGPADGAEPGTLPM